MEAFDNVTKALRKDVFRGKTFLVVVYQMKDGGGKLLPTDILATKQLSAPKILSEGEEV